MPKQSSTPPHRSGTILVRMVAVRERAEQRRPGESKGLPTGESSAFGAGAALLALQRAAGNRATGRMLARYYDENGKWIDGEPPEGYVPFTVGTDTRYRKPPAA